MKKIVLMFCIFFCGINLVSAKENVKLKSCIDGDTIKVIIGEETYTVRMLAVNTPELAHNDVLEEYYAKEASE